MLKHDELHKLTIAHIDCDAFYASVEKRDNPSLNDKAVIIGGGKRGVVSAACYIARIQGVHSAMPMFQAIKKCPNAVVIPPNMKKYSEVSRAIRSLMLNTTPLVEPISIDEAFLDLSGTQRLHNSSAATTLARLAAMIQGHVGITVSIGLSYNKFLAKIASDLDKPNGFSVIGKKNIKTFLSKYPVETIWGVGEKLKTKLARDGIHTIRHLQTKSEAYLKERYGVIGLRLSTFSNGIDDRQVISSSQPKSISKETTFDSDLFSLESMSPILWKLCESIAVRMKNSGVSAKVITLKLKTTNFRIVTRRITLSNPTQLADVLYKSSLALLNNEVGPKYRLMGVGISSFHSAEAADPVDFLNPDLKRQKQLESTIDKIRDKLGDNVIKRGRALEH